MSGRLIAMDRMPGEPVELTTERFVLRTLTPEDASERYLAWLHDPEVTRYLQVRFVDYTLDKLGQYIASHDNVTRFLFGIFTKDGLHIGNYSLRVNRLHEKANIGVMIGDRDYWGKGVILESRAAILDFSFDAIGLFKVKGASLSNNRAAVFNYQRQGWAQEGIRRGEFICDGARVDCIEYAMYRDLWQKLKKDKGQ